MAVAGSPVAASRSVISVPPVSLRACDLDSWSRPTASGLRGEDGDAVAGVGDEEGARPAEDHVAEGVVIGILAELGRSDHAGAAAVDDQHVACPAADDVREWPLVEPVAGPVHDLDPVDHCVLGAADDGDLARGPLCGAAIQDPELRPPRLL